MRFSSLLGRLLRAAGDLRAYAIPASSLVTILVAGAIASDAFGSDASPRAETKRLDFLPPPGSGSVPLKPAAAPPLVLTYYIVESAERQAVLYSLEHQLWNRQWLQNSKIEVLVARDGAEEDAAEREIAAAQVRSPTTTVLVEDLRWR